MHMKRPHSDISSLTIELYLMHLYDYFEMNCDTDEVRRLSLQRLYT